MSTFLIELAKSEPKRAVSPANFVKNEPMPEMHHHTKSRDCSTVAQSSKEMAGSQSMRKHCMDSKPTSIGLSAHLSAE